MCLFCVEILDIDSLLDKLNENRVSQVIDAIIGGDVNQQKFTSDDIQYCKDLGILSATAPSFEIANPIYKQIIPAVLASKFQQQITKDSRCFVQTDGLLDMKALLTELCSFIESIRKHGLQGFPIRSQVLRFSCLLFCKELLMVGAAL